MKEGAWLFSWWQLVHLLKNIGATLLYVVCAARGARQMKIANASKSFFMEMLFLSNIVKNRGKANGNKRYLKG
jgi:hypothetical protein